jgi:sigma-E factor negative regulatory protein RseB
VLNKVIVVFFLAIRAVYAEDQALTAPQWLERMNRAMKALDYHGTVVFMKNNQLDAMKYWHSVENGVEFERLSSLNSPMRDVTRKSNEVSCLFRDSNLKVINHHPIDSSLIINLPQDIASIDKVYELSAQAIESIAMFPAQVISIATKDQFRYTRKIWINTQNFLPLKAVAYDQEGNALEQVLFTDLQIDSSKDKVAVNVLSDDKNLSEKHIHTSQAEPFENAPFVLKNWPNGFKTIFYIRNSMQESKKVVNHLLISDGFSSVSVYLEPKEAQGLNGFNSLGSINSYSQVIDNFQITVLGEVPAKTVQFIASGITLR